MIEVIAVSAINRILAVVAGFFRSHRATVLPVLAVAGASVISGLTRGWGHPIGFLPFIVVVIGAAWIGGLYGGLLTTALSAGALTLGYALAYDPAGEAGLQEFFVRLGLFAFMGGAASYLAMQCQRAVTAYDRLQKTLVNAREAWVFADTRGRVTFLNTLAQAWSGWHLAHARHRPLDQLFVLLHEATRKPIALNLQHIVEQRHAVHLPEDAVLLTAGGATVPVEGCVLPVQNSQDEVVELLLIFRDVSEIRHRKARSDQQEAMFKMLESVPAGAMILDQDGTCVFASSWAARQFDASQEQLLRRGWLQKLSTEARNSLLEALEGAHQQVGQSTVEVEFARQNGEPHWLRLRFRTFPHDGQPGQVVAVVEDLTPLRSLERALEKLRNDAAHQLEQLQEQLHYAEQRLQAAVSRQAETEKRATEERQRLTRQVEELQKKLASQPTVQPELQAALDCARKELADQQSKREAAETALRQAEKTIRELEADLERTWQGQESVQDELDRLQKALETAQLEKGQALVQAAAAKAECEQWQAQLAERDEDHRRKIADLQQRHDEVVRQVEQLRAECERLAAEKDTQAAKWQSEENQLRLQMESLKQDLESARSREGFLSNLLHSVPCAIVAVGPTGRISWSNPAAMRLLGFQVEESLTPEREQEWFPEALRDAPFTRFLTARSEKNQNHEAEAEQPVRRVVASWVDWPDRGRLLTVSPLPMETTGTDRAETRRLQPIRNRDADWLSFN